MTHLFCGGDYLGKTWVEQGPVDMPEDKMVPVPLVVLKESYPYWWYHGGNSISAHTVFLCLSWIKGEVIYFKCPERQAPRISESHLWVGSGRVDFSLLWWLQYRETSHGGDEWGVPRPSNPWPIPPGLYLLQGLKLRSVGGTPGYIGGLSPVGGHINIWVFWYHYNRHFIFSELAGPV